MAQQAQDEARNEAPSAGEATETGYRERSKGGRIASLRKEEVREHLHDSTAQGEPVAGEVRVRGGRQWRFFIRKLARLADILRTKPWLHPRKTVRKLLTQWHWHRAVQIIRESGVFDRDYYLAEYPDVVASHLDPLEHFVRYGANEVRNPSPLFDTSYYLKANPDVARSGINPLAHYIKYGVAEGRDPNPEFHTRRYIGEHPELASGWLNPLVHFARSCGSSHSRSGEAAAELDRWRSSVERQARRALVVDERLLTPDRDSGSITTLELMKTLQGLGYAVTFISADLRHSERYVEALENAGFWCLTERATPSVETFLDTCGAMFDVVVLCRVVVARELIGKVEARCSNAVVLFETIDLHFLRAEREAALTGSMATKEAARDIKFQELDLIQRCDATLVHSTFEQEILAREVPGASVFQMPYVLSVNGRGPDFEKRHDIVFLGGFRHGPNIDAVTHFVQDIFPIVRSGLPGVCFRVVGSDPPDEIKRLACEDVIVTGYVERLQPVLDACRLTVAPLRFGAGYKGKVAMSMTHGVPGVLSSTAAEGMGLHRQGEVLIADQADEFAAEVIRLYRDRDLWEHLAKASIAFAAEHFSPVAARVILEKVLQVAGALPWRDAQPGDQITTRSIHQMPGRAVFPSRFMRELHQRGGLEFEHTTLIPHGVDFKHPSDAPRSDRLNLVETGVLKLLFAGRVVHFKGVHTAIEALPSIIETVPHLDVRLTIVGDTRDTEYMKRLEGVVEKRRLGDRVRFLPAVGEEDLFSLFQRHDIYLFPSLFEPFALTLILALEAGIPTVASTAGGNVDLIVDHRSGLLFPPGDALALAANVAELAGNPLLRRSLSSAGRTAAEKLTLDAMVSRIENCLRAAACDADQLATSATS